MEFSKSFPPADAMIEFLQEVDYQKLYKDSVSFVITVAAFCAAVYTVLRTKWQEHNMTERCQLTFLQIQEKAQQLYTWFRKVFVPFVIEMYDEIRSIYNFLRTV
jgi:hypothetical protein